MSILLYLALCQMPHTPIGAEASRMTEAQVQMQLPAIPLPVAEYDPEPLRRIRLAACRRRRGWRAWRKCRVTDTELLDGLEAWRARGGYVSFGSENSEHPGAMRGPWDRFSCELSGVEGIEGQYREAGTIREAIAAALNAVAHG